MGFGATKETWEAYRDDGWLPMMLPVVSDPKAKIDPQSKLKALGKTPSVLTPAKTVVGVYGWTTMTIDERKFDKWSGKDYGICLRCGNVLAFDCDVEDEKLSAQLLELFQIMFGEASLRRRAGSNRWLAVLRVDIPMSKIIIKFDRNNALEILGSGQQFVAEGTHPSGTRYEWTAGHPVFDKLPVASSDDVQAFAEHVAEEFGGAIAGGRKAVVREKNAKGLLPDPLADWLRAEGLVLNESDGVLDVVCPWRDEHTADTGENATRYYSRGANGEKMPGFKCMHAHCADRNYEDFLAWAHANGYEDPGIVEGLPVIADQPTTEEQAREEKLFRILNSSVNEKTGLIEANLSTVMAALQLSKFGHIHLAYDTFSGSTVYKDIRGVGKPLRGDKAAYDEWVPFGDPEMVLMRERLQREFNFKPVGGDLMRDAVIGVSNGGLTVVDTMVEHINKHLPAWDGVPRVENFLSKYCGCADDEYSAALGKYIFAALAGRALSPNGIKADIVPIFVGKQGTYKSTLIASLALKPGTSRELSFNKSEDDIKRFIRGSSVVEIPELSGMSRKDAADIKFFISLTEDSWIPKYWETMKTVKRRCVFFASTNEHQILNDPTGSRRFAPIETGTIDIDAIRPLIPQLWAEGCEIFRAEGIEHRRVEILAAARASNFELRDPWTEELSVYVNDWHTMPENDRPPLTTRTLLECALGVPASKAKVMDSRRVGNLMRSLGYYVKCTKSGGKTIRLWEKDR